MGSLSLKTEKPSVAMLISLLTSHSSSCYGKMHFIFLPVTYILTSSSVVNGKMKQSWRNVKEDIHRSFSPFEPYTQAFNLGIASSTTPREQWACTLGTYSLLLPTTNGHLGLPVPCKTTSKWPQHSYHGTIQITSKVNLAAAHYLMRSLWTFTFYIQHWLWRRLGCGMAENVKLDNKPPPILMPKLRGNSKAQLDDNRYIVTSLKIRNCHPPT